MRTTVEFPPALMRAAKARSAERGESLKTLLTRALEAELGAPSESRNKRGRVQLPLFGSPASGAAVHFSNADLERVLADEDAAAAMKFARRPRRRRARR